ncbi:ubiquitin family protein [Apiospora kogelbergensis]|uniref:Ubiquitin family protein n=1 Tax=Apiospora kogelbergensis TaxID=1337665 RepID=A0AAW0QK83_9PEZI
MASEDGAPTCTVQVISPSVGVPSGRLSFSDLPASTTIQQLKQRVRDALDAKPPDTAQRLIHRGRLLARDNETLLEIFGDDTLRSGEPQAIHLVLRDLSDGRPTNTPTPPTLGAQPILSQPTSQPGAAPQLQAHHPAPPHNGPQHGHVHHNPQFFPGAQPQVRPAAPWPNLPFGMMGTPQPPNMPPGYNPQQQLTPHQIHLQNMQRTINQQHMVAHENQRIQELINQTQRERAAAGLNGAQDPNNPAANPLGATGIHTPGRTASSLQPDGTRTVVREGVGPNGQQWRITVNESITTNPNFQRNPRTGSPFSMADVQNLWRPPSGAPHPRSVPYGTQPGGVPGPEAQSAARAADAGQAATRVIADAMRRNASTSSLASLSSHSQPIPPGVTTPLIPSRSASAAGTPDPARAAGRSGSSVLNDLARAQMAPSSPEVYILSSPEGPRALLVNGNHGTYTTPQQPQIPFINRAFVQQLPLQPVQLPILGPQPFAPAPQRAPMGGIWAPTPAENAAFQLRNQQQHQQQGHYQQHQQHHQQGHAPVPAPAPHGLPNPPQAQLPPGHHVGHPHANVQIRAIALGQLWPHIWMILRLILFIWWFTSPTSSWSRWFTVITIAVTLFLFNAGLLNPLAEHAWVPMRRHLENLMPLADNHGRNPVVRRRANGQAEDNNAGEQVPNPADTAERLVQERRQANANWFMNQVRRLERASILFLASIAPGVAERHIANVEAEARAERQRHEAAEAAAAEALRAAEESQEATDAQAGQDGNDNPVGDEGQGSEAGPEQQADAGNQNRPGGAEEPLIAI